MQNAGMAVNITIRDVPETVRDELAARARLAGQSMQEYLKQELTRLADRPAKAAWVQKVASQKEECQNQVSAEDILAALASDRR